MIKKQYTIMVLFFATISTPSKASENALAALPSKPFTSSVLLAAAAASVWGISSLADIWLDKKSKDLFSFTSTSTTSGGLTTTTTFSFLPSLGIKQERYCANGVIEQKSQIGFFVYDQKMPAPFYKKIGYSVIPLVVLTYALCHLKKYVSPLVLATVKK